MIRVLEAIRIAPDWPDVYYNLGLVHEKAGSLSDAIKNFQQYIRLAPNASDAAVVKSLINKLEYRFDRLITDPALTAADYRRELDAHLDVLQRSSRECGADYRRVFTDHDYEQVLATFILQRLRAGQAGGGGGA